MPTNRRMFIAEGVGALVATGLAKKGMAGPPAVRFPFLAGNEFRKMEGVHAALFTPFAADGSLNEEMIEREIDYGLRNGLVGFYLTGGTGEGLSLAFDERVRVYRRAVRAARGRAKLIAHVGCARSDEAARLARAAAEAGCDWISSMAPSADASFEAVRRHYATIAAATDLPFIIYAVGGSVIDPERDARLFDIPNVKGMKYTGTDFYSVQRLRRRLDKETIFLSGSDQHFIAALSFGNVFSGSIGTVQNIVPGHFVRIYEAMRSGYWSEAAAWQEETNRIVEFVCHAHSNKSFRKGMMRYIGLDCGSFRPPFAPLTEVEYAALEREADAFGLVRRNQALEPSF